VTNRSLSRLAWTVWSVGAVVFVAVFVFRILDRAAYQPSDVTEPVAFAAIGVVGLVVALHQPKNPIGWIYLVVWIGAAGIFAAVGEYASWVETSHPSAPGEPIAVWLSNWAWVPIFTLLLTYPFLLFPDGHLPSPRWRPLAWAAGITSAFWSVTFALNGGSDYTNANNQHVENPFAAPSSVAPAVDALRVLLSFVMIGFMAAAVASLVVRYRRSQGDEREQIRWLMLAGGVTVFWFLLPLNHGVGGWADAVQGFVLTLIPISVGIAILKYRLYDVDLVIRRTVVFGVLAAFITLVYVAIVVGVGSAIGARGNPVLSGIAAAAVALAFQPVRRWGQRAANRLVYGKRATPYEVLSEFSTRLGDAYDPDDVLPRMARVLAEGTAARRAYVWLHVDGRLHAAASWPVDGETPEGLTAAPLPAEVVPVRHRGELLGALSVEQPPGESLSPTEAKLVDDLAAQAGLVLRNVALTEQLRARLEELRASRQRLVAAQDEERRKLERNIHDGAQQQLVALSVKQRLAASLVGKDDERVRAMLEELRSDSETALDDLRDLARGIYPPLLADKGLAAALAAQARKAALPVTVEAEAIGRFPQEIEATVYFCTLEALNNVAKYAGASHATVRLRNGSHEVRFEVRDDGRGFDPARTGYGTGLQGMADRLAALGGELVVTSSPGDGTAVAGRLPVEGLA